VAILGGAERLSAKRTGGGGLGEPGGSPSYDHRVCRHMLILPIMRAYPRRVADPYRDLDVIDSRAPRFNQATVGLVALLAVATGWWWLLALLAVQLAVGLTFGRQYCLPCLFYFEVVQRVFGEGKLEDARPPRFANMVGAAVVGTAALAYALGAATLGAVLGGLVVVLALLAAATGLCAGCEAYKLGCWLRGEPFVSCPLPPQPARD
jgi:hypothetical protein